MKALVVVMVTFSVLLVGCTEPASEHLDPAPSPERLHVTQSGVTVSANAGAVPPGTDVSIVRQRTPNPVERAEVPGLAALAPAAEITLDGGNTQPQDPLTVAIAVPRDRVGGRGPIGVILQSEGGKPEFVPGHYDKRSSKVVVEVSHLSWVWPVQLDVSKLVDEAMTFILQSTGLETERPDCADDEPTIEGNTYSVIQPAQAWLCLAAEGSDLQVDVFANSPVPFQINSTPRPASSQPITDLGDESTVGAALVRSLGLVKTHEGLIGPGVNTRFTYDGAEATTLDFRSSPPLLLVQIVIATLQPILDAKKIETLGKAKCFHDLVETAQHSRWNASTAASLTAAVMSCAGEVVELTPVGAVILALVSAAPQLFAGSVLGVIEEFTGEGSFRAVIDQQEARAGVPAGFLGSWYVHGGQLLIRANGTARSEGHSSCPSAWSSSWCNDVMEMRVSTEGDRLRLSVVKVYVEDENGRRGTPPYPPSASTGSFYLMKLLPKGAALTELHNDDGAVVGANGLGNPYLCRANSDASRDGTCGA